MVELLAGVRLVEIRQLGEDGPPCLDLRLGVLHSWDLLPTGVEKVDALKIGIFISL